MQSANAISDRTDRIRALNDAFRTYFFGGAVVVTSGVAALNSKTQQTVLNAVRKFTAFDRDNDPYAEHDFGHIEVDGERFFFKIDYYDRALEFGSPNPADPNVTTRVLTVMLADEY